MAHSAIPGGSLFRRHREPRVSATVFAPVSWCICVGVRVGRIPRAAGLARGLPGCPQKVILRQQDTVSCVPALPSKRRGLPPDPRSWKQCLGFEGIWKHQEVKEGREYQPDVHRPSLLCSATWLRGACVWLSVLPQRPWPPVDP